MKIVIDEGNNAGHRLVFYLPVSVVLNNFVASIAPKYLKKCGVDMTKEQAKKTVKELRKCVKHLRAYKRKHPEWKLLEVEGSDGEYIEITI